MTTVEMLDGDVDEDHCGRRRSVDDWSEHTVAISREKLESVDVGGDDVKRVAVETALNETTSGEARAIVLSGRTRKPPDRTRTRTRPP